MNPRFRFLGVSLPKTFHFKLLSITATVLLAVTAVVVSVHSSGAPAATAEKAGAASSENARSELKTKHAVAARNLYSPVPLAPLAPTVTATKTDSLFTDVDGDLQADPGDTLKYTVSIDSTGDDGTGLTFTDTVDPNTAFVPGSLTATPVAVDDSYTASGNIRISVAAPGVLGNDFTGVPAATITAAPVTSANGGDVSLAADGSFTYNPPAGFEGIDSFTYTLTNAAGSNNATVSITVSDMIWFIDNNAATCTTVAAGCGRLTNPFSSLSAFAAVNNGVGNNPAANDNIFLYESAADYAGPVTLLNGQRFLGQDATASLSAMTGITPPAGSDPLPATNSANATIVNVTTGNAITVAQDNTLRGFTGGDSTTDITGAGFSTLTISDVTLNGLGQALNLSNGTLQAGFGGISSANSGTTGISLSAVSGTLTSPTTTISNPAGIGLSVDASDATLSFGNTTSTASGGTGVSLTTNSGGITFGALNISPDSTQRGLLATENSNTITSTSGTISTSGAAAVEITRAIGTTPLVMSLTSVSTSGGPNGITLTNTSGSFTVAGDGSMTAGLLDRDGSGGTISSTTGDSVLLTNTQNVTLRQMNIANAGLDGVEASLGSNVTLSAVDISTPGATNPAPVGGFGSGNGFRATNVTGNIVFDNNSRVSNWQSLQSNAVLLNQTSTNFSSFTVDNAFITTSATGGAGIHANLNGTTTGTVTITDTDLTLIDGNATQIINNGSGTITSIVQRNNFHDADATGGDGNNTFLLTLSGSGQMNFTIGGPNAADGNAFTNLARLSATAGVLQVLAAGGTASAGARLNGTIQNNTLTNPAFVSQRRGIMAAAEASAGSHGGHSIFIGNNSIQNFSQQGIYSSMATVNGAAIANDNLNNNIIISNNLVGNISPIGQGGGDGGSAIEFETLNGTSAVGSDISANVLIQNNTAVSNNSSGIGDAIEINSSGNNAPNTSVVNLTALGNSITQNNAAGQVFEGRTLLNTASSICLDLNAGNTSPNTSVGGNGTGFRITQDAGSGTYSIDGMAAGPQTAAAVQAFLAARNIGPVTASGSFVGAPGGCADATLPSAFALASGDEVSATTGETPAATLGGETPAGAPAVETAASETENVLFISEGKSADKSNATRLQEEWLSATIVPAAIERWRQSGISAADLARLQAVTFEVADLPDGQLATATSSHVKMDATAAGYGWYFDQSPMDDQEFDLTVPGRELQTTQYSLAHGRGVDVLTAVMRQLGTVYLQDKKRVPSQLQPLMDTTLSPDVRRLPDARNIQLPGAKVSASSNNQSDRATSRIAQTRKGAARTNTAVTASPVSARNVAFNRSAKHAAGRNSRAMHHAPINRTRAAMLSMLADVMLNIGTLPAGENVTITFNVIVDDPFTGPLPQVSNQGTVSGSNFADVLTDDPSVGGAADPTVTPIDLPDVSVAVSPASVAEDGATNLVYTFTRNGSTANALTVNFSIGGTATFGASPNDYTQTGAASFTPPTGTVTFGAGNSTATVTVDPETDTTVEPDETVVLTVTSGTGYEVGAPSSAIGTITNDDTDVSVAVSPASVAEDGATNLVYTFTRVGDTTSSLTVNFSVGGTATFGVSPNDYTQTGATTFTPPTGSVTFSPGSSTATVTVDPETDTTVEPDETVILTLTSGTGYNVVSPSSATGTITNDDADVSVAVAPAAVAEDGATNLVYTFTRSGFTAGALTVNFSVGGTATFGPSPNDYTQTGATTYTTTTGSVTFAPASSTATVTVNPEADAIAESDETVIITLTAGASYNVVSPSSATGTILNDDTLVSVVVSPSSTTEGGANLVYTFTRTGPTTSAVTANFSVGGTASFPADYSQSGATTFTPPTATVTFGIGSPTATVTVTPLTDCAIEGSETVVFTVQPGAGYGVGAPSTATGTITNTPDSTLPTITCNADVVVDFNPAVGGAVVTYTAPVGSDNCPGATTTQIAGLPSGSTFPLGTTTNTFRVTDASGNTAECSFDVTVALTSIVGLDSVSITGASFIDSYNSLIGYPASKSSQANVVSNGTITMANSGKVWGSVRSTQAGINMSGASQVTGNATAGTTVSLSGSASVGGTITNHAPAPAIALSPVSACGPPYSPNSGISGTYSYNPVTGNLTLSGVNIATLANGNYCFNNITLTNSAQLKVNGLVTIKMTGTLNLSGATSFTNTTGMPGNLRILSSLASGGNGVVLNNGTNVTMVIYAPRTGVSISGSVPLFGTVAAKRIILGNSGAIHYDTQLKNVWPDLWSMIVGP